MEWFYHELDRFSGLIDLKCSTFLDMCNSFHMNKVRILGSLPRKTDGQIFLPSEPEDTCGKT
jgi:hypothetical protein